MDNTSANYVISPEVRWTSIYAEGNVQEGCTNAETIVKIIILLIICVGGTIGNVLVIVTIAKDVKLLIPGNYFLINLTIADIIITAFSIPVIIKNILRTCNGDQEAVNEITSSGFCATTAYLKIIALHVSWYSLAFIALNRYYSVCRRHQYANFFTKKRILTAVFLVWAWVLFMNIPIILGWAIPTDKELDENSTTGYYPSYPRHGPPVMYDRSSDDCVLGVDDTGGYTYANGLFAMALPLVSIIFCYSLVYMEMVQGRRNVSRTMNAKQIRRRHKRERRISIMLAVVVTAFLICWIPAIIYDYVSDIHSEKDYLRLVFNWLALSNSAMNPGLYAILSKAFRIGYKKVVVSILRSVLCCGKFKKSMEKTLRDLSSESTSRTKSNTTSATPNRRGAPRILAQRKVRQSRDVSLSRLDKRGNATCAGKIGRNEIKGRSQSEGAITLTVPTQYRTGKKIAFYVAPEEVSVIESYSNTESQISKSGLGITESGTNQPPLSNETLGCTPTKKTFVPLIDQLDNSKSLYSAAGIYVGEDTKAKSKRSELNT